jgi:hypothetical protein
MTSHPRRPANRNRAHDCFFLSAVADGEGWDAGAQLKSHHPDPLPVSRGEENVFLTVIIPPEEVREKFKRVKPLKDVSVKQHGWTLDVLNIVRSISKSEFTNEDVYAFARELEQLHPDNRSLRTATGDNPVKKDGAGIRQQWQGGTASPPEFTADTQVSPAVIIGSLGARVLAHGHHWRLP